MDKKTPGRKKTKDRQQKTLYIDRKHLNRMQGVNNSDVVNWALDAYYDFLDKWGMGYSHPGIAEAVARKMLKDEDQKIING